MNANRAKPKKSDEVRKKVLERKAPAMTNKKRANARVGLKKAVAGTGLKKAVSGGGGEARSGALTDAGIFEALNLKDDYTEEDVRNQLKKQDYLKLDQIVYSAWQSESFHTNTNNMETIALVGRSLRNALEARLKVKLSLDALYDPDSMDSCSDSLRGSYHDILAFNRKKIREVVAKIASLSRQEVENWFTLVVNWDVSISDLNDMNAKGVQHFSRKIQDLLDQFQKKDEEEAQFVIWQSRFVDESAIGLKLGINFTEDMDYKQAAKTTFERIGVQHVYLFFVHAYVHIYKKRDANPYFKNYLKYLKAFIRYRFKKATAYLSLASSKYQESIEDMLTVLSPFWHGFQELQDVADMERVFKSVQDWVCLQEHNTDSMMFLLGEMQQQIQRGPNNIKYGVAPK